MFARPSACRLPSMSLRNPMPVSSFHFDTLKPILHTVLGFQRLFSRNMVCNKLREGVGSQKEMSYSKEESYQKRGV